MQEDLPIAAHSDGRFIASVTSRHGKSETI